MFDTPPEARNTKVTGTGGDGDTVMETRGSAPTPDIPADNIINVEEKRKKEEKDKQDAVDKTARQMEQDIEISVKVNDAFKEWREGTRPIYYGEAPFRRKIWPAYNKKTSSGYRWKETTWRTGRKRYASWTRPNGTHKRS